MPLITIHSYQKEHSSCQMTDWLSTLLGRVTHTVLETCGLILSVRSLGHIGVMVSGLVSIEPSPPFRDNGVVLFNKLYVPLSLLEVFLQVNQSNVKTVEHLSDLNAFVLRQFVYCGITLLICRLQRLLHSN